jgi:hypothetical protein
MPQDPQVLFDQTVLQMIEMSPTGSVPQTPSYQDSLSRLYASHQVYAHADHKGCHVTARSLGHSPSFHAANLAELAAGRIAPDALEPNDPIFDRYVLSLPAALRLRAEGFRTKAAGRPVHHRAKHFGSEKLPVAQDAVHSLFLVPGAGPHLGLPGNYLYGTFLQGASNWSIQVHDSDDGVAVLHGLSLPDAVAKVMELLESSPFTLAELKDLGLHLA